MPASAVHSLVSATNIEEVLLLVFKTCPCWVLTLCNLMTLWDSYLLERCMAFSDNVWWTRKAKIQAEKRLLSNAFQSQIVLLWYSFSGVAASIYYLKFNASGAGTDLSGIMWVIYSVLVLCVSGFINGLSFKERAVLIKENYETLTSIYHKAKADNADIKQLISEYSQVLNACENHKDRDYYLALCVEHLKVYGNVDPKTGCKNGLDRCPTTYHWLCVAISSLGRISVLLVLYVLPIALFFLLEYFACQ